MKVRDSRLELLRCISMAMIVLCHVFLIPDGVLRSGEINISFLVNNTLNSIIAQCFGLLGRLGNELFILISGYFLCELSLTKARLSKVLLPVYVYSLISLIVAIFGPIDLGPTLIAKLIFPVSLQTYWFVTPYIFMICIMPCLNLLMRKLDNKQNLYLILFLTLSLSIIPTFTFQLSFQPGFHDVGIFILLYLIAGYIKINKKEHFLRNKTLISILILGFGMQVLNTFVINVFSVNSSNFKYLKWASYLNSQESFFLLLAAVSIFLMFFNIKPFTNKYINLVGATTFGIYLIHRNPIFHVFIFKNAFIEKIQVGDNFIVVSLLYSLMLFIFCFIIDLMRQKVTKRILQFLESFNLKDHQNN